MRHKRFVAYIVLFMFFLSIPRAHGQGDAAIEILETNVSGESLDTVSLDECVIFAVANSFEVKLAKLDLYIAETGLMYSESVFDTFLSGGYRYSEDRRKKVSTALSAYDYENFYYAGIEKTLPSGTDVSINFEDKRSRLQTDYAGIGFYHVPELSINVEQPVGKNMFGFVDRSEITLTSLAIKNSGLDTQDRIEELIAKVERAYWTAVFRKRSMEIYEGILKKAKKLHEVNRRNFDIGMIEKVDFVASEANVAKREAEVIIARNSYRRARENLKLLMNLEEEQSIVPYGTLELNKIREDLADCLEASFKRRRDYEIAKRNAEIKGLSLKVKSNLRWPEIDFVASAALNGIDANFGDGMETITRGSNPYYYVGIEFEVPIENRAAKSEYLATKLEKEKSLVEIKNVERNIITEVGNAFRDVTSFEASLVYIMKAVVYQSEKLAEEEKRFNYGRSTTKNIIDYQQDLLHTELEEAKYLFDHSVSKVNLERDMNVILAKYEEKI